MKSKFLTVALLCFLGATHCWAQTEIGVRNIHSIRATIVPLGVGYGYEHALSQRVTLNTELLLSGGISSGTSNGLALFGVSPLLRVEPRFYYSYLKRAEKGKKVLNNSASFLSLSLENKFNAYLTNVEGRSANEITVVPKWGLRRPIGQHIFFEGAIGAGASYNRRSKFRLVQGIDARFGYAF